MSNPVQEIQTQVAKELKGFVTIIGMNHVSLLLFNHLKLSHKKKNISCRIGLQPLLPHLRKALFGIS